MTEVGFYHLTKMPLERALPRLLEKILDAKKRAVVKVSSPERVEAINSALWNTGRGSFLPHGSQQDGNAAEQPIWITAGDENPNGAQFLLLADSADSSQLTDYERCLDLFDGNDAQALAHARQRWKHCANQGIPAIYWKQSSSGSWEKG